MAASSGATRIQVGTTVKFVRGQYAKGEGRSGIVIKTYETQARVRFHDVVGQQTRETYIRVPYTSLQPVTGTLDIINKENQPLLPGTQAATTPACCSKKQQPKPPLRQPATTTSNTPSTPTTPTTATTTITSTAPLSILRNQGRGRRSLHQLNLIDMTNKEVSFGETELGKSHPERTTTPRRKPRRRRHSHSPARVDTLLTRNPLATTHHRNHRRRSHSVGVGGSGGTTPLAAHAKPSPHPRREAFCALDWSKLNRQKGSDETVLPGSWN